eukprot:558968-Pyramimonas_sp.AAC.1
MSQDPPARFSRMLEGSLRSHSIPQDPLWAPLSPSGCLMTPEHSSELHRNPQDTRTPQDPLGLIRTPQDSPGFDRIHQDS